jgi:hypothetical protein
MTFSRRTIFSKAHIRQTPDVKWLKESQRRYFCDFIGTTTRLPKKSSENLVGILTPAISAGSSLYGAASVPTCSPIETPAKTTGVSVPTAFRDAGKCIISVGRHN